MSTHSHTVLFGQEDGLVHHYRITGVKTAGHVGRSNVLHNLLVIAQPVPAVAFAHVDIEIHDNTSPLN
jgi:hypothetical protein